MSVLDLKLLCTAMVSYNCIFVAPRFGLWDELTGLLWFSVLHGRASCGGHGVVITGGCMINTHHRAQLCSYI